MHMDSRFFTGEEKEAETQLAEDSGTHRGTRFLSAQHLSQDMRQHLSPPWPVVIYVRPPKVECVRNIFRLEDAGKLFAPIGIFVRALPRHDVDRIGLSQDRQVVIVIQFREVIDGIVEIDVVIVEAIQERTNVVAAAHRNRALEEIRMLEVFVRDRKSTRLNSSHSQISYAVFCLKKKKKKKKKKSKQH